MLRLPKFVAGAVGAVAIAVPTLCWADQGFAPSAITNSLVLTVTEQPSEPVAHDADNTSEQTDESLMTFSPGDRVLSREDERHAVCVAKVIVHEAGNQPYVGQVAVAQTIRNRIKDGRFGRTACSVVSQPGQFFNVAAYEPSRRDQRWHTAYRIAAATLSGLGKDVVPGALFFRSGTGTFAGRTLVASVADHRFYR